jgi:hypothetical protein
MVQYYSTIPISRCILLWMGHLCSLVHTMQSMSGCFLRTILLLDLVCSTAFTYYVVYVVCCPWYGVSLIKNQYV